MPHFQHRESGKRETRLRKRFNNKVDTDLVFSIISRFTKLRLLSKYQGQHSDEDEFRPHFQHRESGKRENPTDEAF